MKKLPSSDSPQKEKRKTLLSPKFKRKEIFDILGTFAAKKFSGTEDAESEWEQAFSLDVDDKNMRVLFEHFDLDPENPLHWRSLLEAFAKHYVVFTGRPEMYGYNELFELAVDIVMLPDDESSAEQSARKELFDISNDEEEPTISEYVSKLQKTYHRYKPANDEMLRKQVANLQDSLGDLRNGPVIFESLYNLDPERLRWAMSKWSR